MGTNIDHKAITEETAKQLVRLIKEIPKDTVQKSYEFAKKPVYSFRSNQIIAGITGTTGLIMFAFGIENFISQIPELSSPFIEVGLGLFLLIISGLFLKKLF